MNQTATNQTLPTKIFSKFFILVFFVDALQATVSQMMNTTLAKYVLSLGGTTSLAGAISTGITLVTLVCSLLCGNLVDRYGRSKIIRIGLAVSIVALAFCGVPVLALFIVFRIVQAGGNSAVTAGTGTVVADIAPKERLGEATGYYGFAQSVSTAAGPSLSLLIVAALGYRPLFFICAALLVAAFVLMQLCNYEKVGYGNPRQSVAQVAQPKNFLLRFIEPKALPASIVQFFYFTACAFTVYYLATYAEEYGIAGIGLFYTASAIGMLVSRLFSGRLSDHVGALPVLTAGILLGIVSFVLLLLASAPAVICAGGIYGFALGLITPPLQSTAIRAASDSRRGVATCTFVISISVGIGAGGALFGVMIDLLGYRSTILGAIALMVLSLLLSFLFFRKKRA